VLAVTGSFRARYYMPSQALLNHSLGFAWMCVVQLLAAYILHLVSGSYGGLIN
jgi:hypothetical protein